MFPHSTKTNIGNQLIANGEFFCQLFCSGAPSPWFVASANLAYLILSQLVSMVILAAGYPISVTAFPYRIPDIVALSSAKEMLGIKAWWIITFVQSTLRFAKTTAEKFERYAMGKFGLSFIRKFTVALWKSGVWPFKAFIGTSVSLHCGYKKFESGRMTAGHLALSWNAGCLASSLVTMGPLYFAGEIA